MSLSKALYSLHSIGNPGRQEFIQILLKKNVDWDEKHQHNQNQGIKWPSAQDLVLMAY